MLYKHLTIASMLATAIAATPATIQLHESPSADSTVISSMEMDKGVTILPSKWAQVQDPVTKKIGWVTQDDVQQILKTNNATITTMASNNNGSYSSVTEIHNFTSNEPSTTEIAKTISEEEQRMKHAFKENLLSFQKMSEITNSIFDNMFSETA